MLLLENEHRSQTNSAGAATTNVHTQSLGLGQELVALRTVKGNKCTLTLATKVLDLARIFVAKSFEVFEKAVTDPCGVVDEVVLVDFIDNSLEKDGTGRVSHPCVELTVRLVGADGRVAIIETGSLSLLRKGNNIRRRLKVPVLMSPELAGGTDTCLDLVHYKENVMLLG